MEKKCRDFVFSIFMALFSVYLIIEGFLMYRKAASPPFNIQKLTLSPAFLPVILALVLLLCSLVLLDKSIKQGTQKDRNKELKRWFGEVKKSKDVLNMVVGTVIMFFYSFFLVNWLPFWLSSLIFLLVMFFILKIGKPIKVVLIATLTIGAIMLLFVVGFGASLP